MLSIYMFVTIVISLMVILVPITVIVLFIIFGLRLFAGTNYRSRQQLYQQKQTNYSIAEANKKKKEAEEKAAFDALPEEKKLEILTQKYLVMLACDFGCNNQAAPLQIDTCSTNIDEDEMDASESINNRLKGFFGFEYNDFFEGFAVNESTDEEYAW